MPDICIPSHLSRSYFPPKPPHLSSAMSRELPEAASFKIWILFKDASSPFSYRFSLSTKNPNLDDLRRFLIANHIEFFDFDNRLDSIRLETPLEEACGKYSDGTPLLFAIHMVSQRGDNMYVIFILCLCSSNLYRL